MFCCNLMKRGKEKNDVSCTEPERGVRIQGDGTQESASKEPAVLLKPMVDTPNSSVRSQEIQEENGASELQSKEPVVSLYLMADTPNSTIDSQENHEENGAGEIQSEALKLLPKHRIFLSHSGAQKPFVEQLCVDLENAGHFPFFDSRPESLPKGEGFPDLILQAARQCHVAVVVLSMDYLMSKWPMLELIAFDKEWRSENSNLKILPLFYKIGVEDLKREHDCITSVWTERAERDTRLNPKDFDSALRLLSVINGEVFTGVSELAYRRAIVASICKLYPPDVQFDVSAMQGRDRLCDVVVAELDNLNREQKLDGASIVGVHGMGGMGKTLLCKALCNLYHSDFAGRVLHVELKGYKDSSKQENIIDAQKFILEALTDASTELLRRVASVEQGNKLLYDRLRGLNVFLALDNVPEGSTEWIQILLHLLSWRSKAILTSRSIGNLKKVLEGKPIDIHKYKNHLIAEIPVASVPRENISYILVPTLDKHEALAIFLQHALAPTRLLSPFTVEEMEVLETCIKRCFYLNKDQPVDVVSDSSHVSGHYHPLSLQALGSYLKEIDPQEPLQWIQKSKILQERRLFYKHSVFEILRAGYDALPSQRDKLIFLDIAVFAPRGKLNNLHDLCNWLGAIHGMDQELTLYKMKNLQRNSLIEDWEKNKTLKVTVHDLYVDFAEHQIHLEELQRWCVYETDGRTLPPCLKSDPPGLRWSSLVRLRLQTASVIGFPYEKLREWANLVVLDINLVQHKSFDISPLKCLRSLKLKSFILETLIWSDNMEELRYVKLSCERLVQEPDFSTCSNLLELNMRFASSAVRQQKLDSLQPLLSYTLADTLKVLRLRCWNPKFPEILVLGKLPNLEVVEIVNDLGFSRHAGSFVAESLSVLTHLRALVLKNLPIRGSLPGLENLVSLEYLVLNRCRALNDLPGLGKLTNLQVLDASSTAIEEFFGLKELLQLRGLYLVNCNRLKSLPDLQSLGSLKEVFTMGCTSLSSQPLVSESCTLISGPYKYGIIDLWGSFLYYFYYWTDQSSRPDYDVDFQRMLSMCPTAESFDHGLFEHEGLKELSEAFQDAFRMVHKMAGEGRTNQEFDPETDLVICSKIVSIIPYYANHRDIRMLSKGYGFSGFASSLRALVKRYQI